MRKINQPGYVYLIANGQGLYKIGYSIFPERRIKSLQRESSIELTLYHTIYCNDAYGWEQAFHSMFDHCRVHSEWFALDPLDISTLMRFPKIANFNIDSLEWDNCILPYRYDNMLRPITPRNCDGSKIMPFPTTIAIKALAQEAQS